MPLPDERPRQSVANLIGRFEQQNRRTSNVGSNVPVLPPTVSLAKSTSQTSSISSQVGVKELFKPPVPEPAPELNPQPTAPTEAPLPKSPSPPPPEVLSPPEITPPAVLEPATEVQEPIPEPVASPAQPEPSPPKPIPTKSKSPAPKSAGSPPRSTGRSSTVKATPVKPAVKARSVSKPRESAPAALKPQHTGQSVTSTSSRTAKPRISAGAGVSRPKTPSATPVRPAVVASPSSGLYAPTAASLARSRRAISPTPTPKRTASVSVPSPSLSKPTAASASKARAPVAQTKAASGSLSKSPSSGSNAGTTVASKTVNPRIIARAKQQAQKPGAVLAAAKSARQERQANGEELKSSEEPSASHSPAVDVDQVTEKVSSPHEEAGDATLPPDVVSFGQSNEELVDEAKPKHEEDIERYDSDFPEDVSEAPPAEELVSSHVDSTYDPFVVGSEEPSAIIKPSEEAYSADENKPDEVVHPDFLEAERSTTIEVEDKTSVSHDSNNDLESMVHMLESGIRRSPSPLAVKLTDDVADIPDEF
ncbi:hypothetical protein SISNIDRAFT_115458 [Sistotremastrum niveocremeum HHB9708]|uniref:Uncharacterized protein n=1 Tax=Sistotremastrum niveocremeum HHB9708 TaxID=1314777 RepID=A0A164TMG3_9AGAM|nr:hypothetical protein SISNIDRAFT_115458 [Sistotremastrum niveocremeum HHB9708]